MDHIEVTVTDRKWPVLELIVKSGTRVETAEALYTAAPDKFKSTVSQTIDRVLDRTIQRRKQHGS